MQSNQVATILNSRQSKYPLGKDQWVKSSVEAVRHLQRNNFTLLTSLGMNTWELTLAIAAQIELPVLIVVPQSRDDSRYSNDILNRFNLRADRVRFIFINYSHSRSKKSWWADRDEYILEKADLLFPVSVRPGGRMEQGLDSHSAKVQSQFRILYDKTVRRRPVYQDIPLNREIMGGNWLIHFTRSTPGPWPGEREIDYYRRIMSSTDEFCNSAIRTLNHILDEGTIRAGSRNLRARQKGVSFTVGLRSDPGMFFRYRPRLVNAYFEPYGIAIDKKAAKKVGIRPVIYGDTADYKMLKDSERPFFQNIGKNDIWREEKEWRYIDNLDLRLFPLGAVRVIIYHAGERRRIKSRVPFEIISFC